MRLWVGLVLAMLLSGCASYSLESEPFLQQVQYEQWEAAEQKLAQTLARRSQDRLLYGLELGMLLHLQGEFERSNEVLEQAKDLADALYTRSVTEELRVLFSNPRQRVYRSQDFERLYIEYVQALNYLALTSLPDARVMVRQIEIQLNDLAAQRLSYEEQEAFAESVTGRLMSLFRLLNGNTFDPNEFVLRDNAWLRYLSGVVYEQLGELNEARVAYQQAAVLYSAGYREQYGLDEGMQEQAWFDALRVMRAQGVWEDSWPKLAETHLGAERLEALQNWQAGQAEVVVIEHLGWVPARREMNALLLVNERTKNIEVYPFSLGTPLEVQAQQLWFYLLYSDKGLARLALNIYQDGLRGMVRTPFSKTVYLAPLWDQVTELGLDRAAQTPVRVTIPYYNLFDIRRPTEAEILINGEVVGEAWLADAPAMMAVFSQLVRAHDDFYAAVIRALLKRRGVQALTQDNQLLSLLGDLSVSATEAAETRNWLTLPGFIRVSRHSVEAGELRIEAQGKTRLIEVVPGEIKVIQLDNRTRDY